MLNMTCRYGNPTTRVVEEKIKELEGAEDCLVSSSGNHAIRSTQFFSISMFDADFRPIVSSVGNN